MGTHPGITSLIVLSISTSGQPVRDTLESDIDLRDVLNAQTDIGWDLLWFGFAATAWKNTQHNWVKHRYPNYNYKSFKNHCGSMWQQYGTTTTS